VLSSIEIENFKCISSRIRIDVAPLTLLFGANNAGKSTILQSLLYLLELLQRGHADVDCTELGGEHLDLCGFARIVYSHDLTRTLAIRVTFDTPLSLNCFGRDLAGFPFRNLDDEVESAWIEARVRWLDAPGGGAPFVSELLIGIPGAPDPIVRLWISQTPREGDPLHAAINLGHPLLTADAEAKAAFFEGMPVAEEGSELIDVAVSRGTRASLVPSLDEPLRLVVLDDREPPPAVSWATSLIEMLVLGTARQLVVALREAIHVGPLRAVPPRGFLSERSARVTRWADGLAAWDALLADRNGLVRRTNTWLQRLGAGCKLVVQQLFDPRASVEALSAEHGEATIRRLLLEVGPQTVLPCEVGAGISQIVPILVAALHGSRRGLVLLEQPELHVHPALQVALGDFFIEASRERQLIVETHSEHLLLRLLRRIRETTENDLPDGAPAFTHDRLSVLYVEAGDDGMQVRKLRVDPTGEFMDRWPKGFFEERAEEVF